MKPRAISGALMSVVVATTALSAASPFALAQDQNAKDMKGPPNANGYGKDKMGDTVVKDDKAPSAKDMKGPPNANGYAKDAK